MLRFLSNIFRRMHLERANKKPLPKIELIDMKNELNLGNKSIFSYKLQSEIEDYGIDEPELPEDFWDDEGEDRFKAKYDNK